MYNALVSTAVALVVFGLVAVAFQPLAAILPALIALGVAWFVLARRVSTAVEADMAEVVKLLQARKVDEGVARIRTIQARWGRWQFLLGRQLDAQVGMIAYMQMKFDEAQPLLQAGSWRNWLALACLGCIHYRKGDKEAAWKAFSKAADAASKEPMVYVVWATLLARDEKREEALGALARGLKQIPDNKLVQGLRDTIANKKRVDTKTFPQTWYQFFPEDLARQATPTAMPRHGAVMGVHYPMPKMSRRSMRGR